MYTFNGMYSRETMILSSLALLPALVPAPETVRLEAEAARLDGPRIAVARSGFSGSGYATDITGDKARIVWSVRAAPGIYLARVRFATPGGPKGFEVSANGSRSAAMFPDTRDGWAIQDAGRIELRAGDNEVAIERGWGYYDVDYLELVPAPKPRALKPVPDRLVDAKASPEARALYTKLLKSYGAKTWSGQYEPLESEYVREKTGRRPAILGGDLMDFSPSRLPYFAKSGEVVKDPIPGLIAATKAGQAVTLSWHWNAPFGLLNTTEQRWYSGFYTKATTFDVTRAMADPNSEERKGIDRDIDAIAVQLKRLQTAKVPVLWRPLHEAEGGWFWWGAKGPAPAKWLYRLTYERLMKRHGLHNLIWVWNSGKADWYPGDDVVDVMSVDHYPSDRRDALSSSWDDLLVRFDGRKPLALAEFPGAPDVARMRRFGVRWLYFTSWTGDVGPKSTSPDLLRSTYRSPFVVNAK